MVGAFIGDVVGSVYEFNNLKTTDFPLFTKKNRFTDDSVMTLALTKAFLETDLKAESCRVERFKENLISAMHEMGHKYPDAGYGGRFSYWLINRNRKPYNSFGNGSAMRVSPCGWVFQTLEETESFAKASAEVTHNHPEGIKGAVAVAGAIFLARTGHSKEEIKAYAEKYYEFDFSLDDIRPYYTFDVSCQGSVPQALQAFFESENFENSIRLAISIGGDSDTIGAITGSVSEAYYGVNSEMREAVLGYFDDYQREILFAFEDEFNCK